MKTLNLLFAFAFLFFIQIKLLSQDTTKVMNGDTTKWNLEKCINYAIENNIQVKQMTLQTKSSKSALQQSRANLLPSVNADASHSWNFSGFDPSTSDQLDGNFRTINASISGSVTLFNGLQQYNTINRNNYTLQADLEELEDMKYNITLQVATAYLQILFDKELLDVASSQLEITKGQEQRTKILVEAGSLAKGNLLEIQAQLAQEELNRINAENNLKTSYLNLTQLLELDTTGGFEILVPELEDPSQDMMIESVSKIFEDSQGLPMIKKQELRLQSSEKSLLISKGMISPQIYLSASFGSYYSSAAITSTTDLTTPPFSNQFSDNMNLAITLGVRVPLFNNFTVKNNITQSKLQVENSKYELDLAKNQLYKDIQTARNSAEASLAKYNASKKAVAAQEESFSYTQQKFDLGLVNSVDYNTAKNQLTKSQSDMVQAKFEFIFRINILNFYQGMPFQL
ncbi:MAG: TolC family protein [Chloroflexia bacterium]|nr:TolC family protein [Chloroflexia bacterium]